MPRLLRSGLGEDFYSLIGHIGALYWLGAWCMAVIDYPSTLPRQPAQSFCPGFPPRCRARAGTLAALVPDTARDG